MKNQIVIDATNATMGRLASYVAKQALLGKQIAIVNSEKAIITGNKLNTFTARSPLHINTSNSTGWSKLYLKAGNYNISANATGHLGWTEPVTISNNEIRYENITLGTGNFTIKASSILSGLFVENFTIKLDATDYDYSITKKTKNGSIFGSHNDSIVFRTIAGNYEMTINVSGFEDVIKSKTIDLNDTHPNYTFGLYTENSFNFTFYDEQTSELINFKNVTIELVSNASTYNYTTDIGTLYVDLIVPSLYLMRFSAEGYSERHYYFNLKNKTHNLNQRSVRI